MPFRRGREPGVGSCGAAIGGDEYATSKPKELEAKLCGSGTERIRQAFHHHLGTGSRRPTRGSRCDKILAPGPSGLIMGVLLPEETKHTANTHSGFALGRLVGLKRLGPERCVDVFGTRDSRVDFWGCGARMVACAGWGLGPETAMVLLLWRLR